MQAVTVNRYSLTAEHVPIGVICELKICENCGKSFTRKVNGGTKVIDMRLPISTTFTGELEQTRLRVDTGRKFCGACCTSMLLPVDDDEYREMLPKIQHHGYHLPRYDNSLLAGGPLEAKTKPAVPRKKRNYRTYTSSASWKPALLEGFSKKGLMTLEEIQDFIPKCYTPRDAYVRCRTTGVVLDRVGWGDRKGTRGHGPGIYKLVSIKGIS